MRLYTWYQTMTQTNTRQIHDLNSRLEEVCRELAKMGGTHPPLTELHLPVPWPEDMGAVLGVKDEEVGATCHTIIYDII